MDISSDLWLVANQTWHFEYNWSGLCVIRTSVVYVCMHFFSPFFSSVVPSSPTPFLLLKPCSFLFIWFEWKSSSKLKTRILLLFCLLFLWKSSWYWQNIKLCFRQIDTFSVHHASRLLVAEIEWLLTFCRDDICVYWSEQTTTVFTSFAGIIIGCNQDHHAYLPWAKIMQGSLFITEQFLPQFVFIH